MHKYVHKYLLEYLTSQTFAQKSAQRFAQILRLQIFVHIFVQIFLHIFVIIHKYLHTHLHKCPSWSCLSSQEGWVRPTEAILTYTHTLCFNSEIKFCCQTSFSLATKQLRHPMVHFKDKSRKYCIRRARQQCNLLQILAQWREHGYFFFMDWNMW